MSFRADRAEPCWEVHDEATGVHPNEDGWPHHATEFGCLQEVAEWARDYEDEAPEDRRVFVAARSFSKPCLVIECDGCRDTIQAFEWSHLDPDDPLPCGADECGFVEVDGKHYHENCAPESGEPDDFTWGDVDGQLTIGDTEPRRRGSALSWDEMGALSESGEPWRHIEDAPITGSIL